MMDRWKEHREGKLEFPAIVQQDRSGVLVAVVGGGYVGPLKERKGWAASDYVALAESQKESLPEPEPDYRAKYEELQAAVNKIDTTALKTVIVADLTRLQTVKALAEEVSK